MVMYEETTSHCNLAMLKGFSQNGCFSNCLADDDITCLFCSLIGRWRSLGRLRFPITCPCWSPGMMNQGEDVSMLALPAFSIFCQRTQVAASRGLLTMVLLAAVSRGALLRAAGVCSFCRCVLCVGTAVCAWQEASSGGKHDLALCCPGAFSHQRALSSQNLCDTIRTPYESICLSVCLLAEIVAAPDSPFEGCSSHLLDSFLT